MVQRICSRSKNSPRPRCCATRTMSGLWPSRGICARCCSTISMPPSRCSTARCAPAPTPPSPGHAAAPPLTISARRRRRGAGPRKRCACRRSIRTYFSRTARWLLRPTSRAITKWRSPGAGDRTRKSMYTANLRFLAASLAANGQLKDARGVGKSLVSAGPAFSGAQILAKLRGTGRRIQSPARRAFAGCRAAAIGRARARPRKSRSSGGEEHGCTRPEPKPKPKSRHRCGRRTPIPSALQQRRREPAAVLLPPADLVPPPPAGGYPVFTRNGMPIQACGYLDDFLRYLAIKPIAVAADTAVAAVGHTPNTVAIAVKAAAAASTAAFDAAVDAAAAAGGATSVLVADARAGRCSCELAHGLRECRAARRRQSAAAGNGKDRSRRRGDGHPRTGA